MKRFVFLLLLALSWGKIVAEEYPFLNIEQANGTVTTFESIGTTFTFKDGKMNVTRNGSSTSISLTDLNKMYFSTTSDIKDIDLQDDKPFTVVSITGVKIGEFDNISDLQNQLKTGVYIIEKGKQKHKIAIK